MRPWRNRQPVIGVPGPGPLLGKDVAYVRTLGAERVIDVDHEDLAAEAGSVDLAINAVRAPGELQVAVAATFPWHEGRAAYESGATPRQRPGKTVLVVCAPFE